MCSPPTRSGLGEACLELAGKGVGLTCKGYGHRRYGHLHRKVGVFDVVFLLGVLYHLRHPLLALEKVASVTKETLILSTWVDMLSIDRPALLFIQKPS